MARYYYKKKKKKFVPKDLASLKELKIKTALMESIPEDITQLYPEARNIKRHFILHIGETNTGKTHDALEDFYNADAGMYLAPLRLLALEIQEMSLARGINCSLTTGEEKDIRDGAKHLSCTVEKMDMSRHFDVCVIDEAQMVADSDRGWAWTEAILGVNADVVHVCMSPNAIHIVKMLIKMCGDTYTDIRHKRNSRLIVEDHDFIFPDDIRDGDALVAFSRRKVLMLATLLKKEGYKVSVIYGSLPYSVRKAEVARFLNGESRIVVCTDAIGMGVNLPIRRIIFTESKKFDGKSKRLLNMSEVKQIAGRAGRKGIYDEGKFTAGKGRKFIRRSMSMKPEDINFARIRFPRFLTAVEGKLSDVMNKWDEVETESLFLKADIEQQLKLCEWIENYTDNKDLIYRLINVPFNEKNDDMVLLWQTLAKRVAEEHTVDLTGEIEVLDIEKRRAVSISDINKRIQELEWLYQKYDLIHNFVRLFGMPDTREEQKELIRKKKKEVSDTLTEVLKTKQLKRRQCPDCGRALPYNYQYGVCESCYSMRNRGYGYWGDEWF